MVQFIIDQELVQFCDIDPGNTRKLKAMLLFLASNIPLYSDIKSVTKMQKPDKIYIHNPNMLCMLSEDIKVGTLRECFVVNQLAVNHTVEYGKAQGDFKIDICCETKKSGTDDIT